MTFFILDRHKLFRLQNKFEVLIVFLQIVPIQTYVEALTIPLSPIPQDIWLVQFILYFTMMLEYSLVDTLGHNAGKATFAGRNGSKKLIQIF